MLLWLVAGIGLLLFGLGAVRLAAAMDPKTLLLVLKTAGVALVVVVVGVLVVSGRLGWLLALLPLLLPLVLRRGGLGTASLGGLGGAGRAGGQTSQVRTRFFAMSLDHNTGELDGVVLEGPYTGQPLSELDVGDLLAMLPQIRVQDGKSGRLLEAYLDRRCPDWRASGTTTGAGEGDDARSETSSSDPAGAMSREEACQVLGLGAEASAAEIRAAHQRLIRHLHPDRGGSSFLAAQVNRARDRLLGERRRP